MTTNVNEPEGSMDILQQVEETNTDLEMIAEQINIHKMILEHVVSSWRTE